MHDINPNYKQALKALNCCVIVPTYNNQNTVARVISGVLEYSNDVIVVNDGATDSTPQILQEFGDKISVVTHPHNKGKGMALRNGFKAATEKGFSYAITIDSDGQHYPDDIPVMIEAMQQHPGCAIMGSRNMQQAGVPGKSSFGNKFSNFWFKLETGLDLPDTQTGYRVYPLDKVKQLSLFTTKFELEIEVMVKLAWKGVDIIPIPIKVKYDPNERVTHFRPFRDFTRISILNTYLVILTALYYLPHRLLKKYMRKGIVASIKEEVFNPEEPDFKKAASIGFGVFMGIFPAWGFQMLIAFIFAMLFRLNKVLVIASSNISITPMIPPIIFTSYLVGGYFVADKITFDNLTQVNIEAIHLNIRQYLIGSVILAAAMGILAFIITLLFSRVLRRRTA